MNLKILFLFFILIIPINDAFSELALLTNNQVYSEGQPLFVYGKGQPDETLIIRLFAPDETIANFDQIITTSDGSFNHVLLTWPPSSPSFPFGTYTGSPSTEGIKLATSPFVKVSISNGFNPRSDNNFFILFSVKKNIS